MNVAVARTIIRTLASESKVLTIPIAQRDDSLHTGITQTTAALEGAVVAGECAPTQCAICGAVLFDEAEYTGFSYRFANEPTLQSGRLYCRDYNRRTVRFPTLGMLEVLFGGTLDRQGDSLVVSEVFALNYSPPVVASTAF